MRVLFLSLYHPDILRGGAQMICYDLFKQAKMDPEIEDAHFLGAIDANEFRNYGKVGAHITGFAGKKNEALLLTQGFDNFYQTSPNPHRIDAFLEYLEWVNPDVIHVNHSLLIGLELLRAMKESAGGRRRIVYTLHEYAPICFRYGQLVRANSHEHCTNFSPEQCTQCFPEIEPDKFFLRKRFFLDAFKYVDEFISPSAALKERFVTWGLPQEKIEVIPNGHVRLSNGTVCEPSSKVNKFGFFGQYVDNKGVDILLEAAEEVGNTTDDVVEVHIYGGSRQYASKEYIEHVDEIIKRMPDNVLIYDHGSYLRQNVIDKMGEVDWVVVPSRWPETFGLVVSEAWEAGRPVIAADIGGLSERINRTNGMLFTSGNKSSLAAVMMKSMNNKRLWKRISHSIPGEISMQEGWRRHMNVFKSVLNEEKPESREGALV